MKTTLEIQDALLRQAKRHAQRVGRPLRAIVEEGLRAVLTRDPGRQGFVLEDCSVGTIGAPNPLESLTQDELRELMHGGR